VVKGKTALINQTRGLLAEYGIVIAKGALKFRKELPEILEDTGNALTPTIRAILILNQEMLRAFDRQKEELEQLIKNFAKENEDCKRLMKVPGVGILSSTLFVSTVGDPRQFKNGRAAAAWLGLVPRQNTTGGRIRLLGITKAGDQHLRTALIHGARSQILSCIRHDKKDGFSEWVKKLVDKKGWNKASVAVANKMTRIMWHLWVYKEEFDAKQIA
jgi:transposase